MRLKHPAVEPKCDSSATKEDAIMPLVRIDISKTASRERVRDVGNAVYNAMIAVANVPEYDRFQVVTRHGQTRSSIPKRATSASTRRRS
jgi:hypothetical protein